MKTDIRLARMLHVLIFMGLSSKKENSETIAEILNTPSAIVRRTMGALRLSGIVSSTGGRAGGWILEKPLDQITVLDVQRSLQKGSILTAPVSSDQVASPIEQAANKVLTAAYEEADKALEREFRRTTLAEIAVSITATSS